MPTDPPHTHEGHPLKIYSEEEITMFMRGDRREIDHLLLHGLNNLAIFLIEHAEREEKVLKVMGDAETIKARSAWIDGQIDAQRTRTGMMKKVAESSAAWALILFLGFIGNAAYEYIKSRIKEKIG